MQVSGINSITPQTAIRGTETSSGQSSFTNILSEAIGSAKEAEKSVSAQNAALLTGETDDLHTPMIEAQKAEIILNLAVQVRNKVIEAYNEVMRMQV